MKITVIGPGRWGSCIAWYLNRVGQDVTLYGRETSKAMQAYLKDRHGEYLTLPDSIELTTNIDNISFSEIIIISVPAQSLNELTLQLKYLNLKNKIFVLCMKGIEIETGRRLSQIVQENLGVENDVAVWLGPGHVQEFYNGIPNCMVIDSDKKKIVEYLIDNFSSNLIRFYYGHDLIGNEIGAAAKNIIGIAAGMLDGLGLTTLKGALMSRGTREIARLIKAMGGNELSAYGLCHLGDYEATVFSPFSHNRKFGEMYVKGEKFDHLAEGFYTVKAIMNLSKKYNVELPICEIVYKVLYEKLPAIDGINTLFSRALTIEF